MIERILDPNDPEDRDFVTQQCAVSLACLAASSDSGIYRIALYGVSCNGVELGDWVVSVDQIPDRKRMN